VLPPTGVHSPAPDPAAYLPTVIRFWLDHQQRPVEAVS